ncbi:hypothetical protein [Cyanobium sp. Morenito 9A2]|nr:hypothetical protein [Cyanobium sp. Morenito 9A2]
MSWDDAGASRASSFTWGPWVVRACRALAPSEQGHLQERIPGA